MHRALPILILSLAAGDLLAQSVVVPNANANTRGVSGLNTLTRNAGNPRTYMLGVPASELATVPVGAEIVGVSFRSYVGTANPATWPPSDTTWTDYEVTVGPAAPLNTWTGVFANQWATGSTPVQVRDGAMLITTNTFANNTSLPAPQPNPFGNFFWDFQKTFTYTGGDLALLFTHPGSSQATSAFYLDNGTNNPTTGVAYAATGFQMANGTASSPYIARVHWGYGKGCAGTGNAVPMLVSAGDTTGGGTATFSIANAKASSPAAVGFGIQRTSASLPNGCTLLTAPLVILPVTLDANGRFLLNLGIAPGVTGAMEAQAFVIDAGAPGGYCVSNGVSFKAN
ncbi:MAG: hypothetical protein IT458_13920 [Planctomycetes bacterium]|nr:hypothetical protein [Planctomycetota bacterium]